MDRRIAIQENQKEMKKFAKDKMKTEISNKKIRGMLTVASGECIGIPLNMASRHMHVQARIKPSFRSKDEYENSASLLLLSAMQYVVTMIYAKGLFLV